MGGPQGRDDAVGPRFASNPFGLAEAVGGLVAGFVLATVAVSIFGALSGHANHPSGYGSDVASLLGLWTGLVGGALVASARARAADGPWAGDPTPGRSVLARLATDYGLAIRPIDLPVGVVVGIASQYLLVPLLELPLLPFVPHLYSRLSQPAISLTGTARGPGLVLLGVLVCLGSPCVEELYFRGLLLRATAGRLAGAGRGGAVASVVIVGVVFGLVHFEPLEFLALAGFGMVLCVLAWRTGRLGPGIVAHLSFNTVAFVSVVRSH